MRVWETTSGGVSRAETTKEHRIAYLRFLRKPEAVTMPRRARKKMKRGSSKMTPKAMRSFREKPRYSRMVGMGRIKSVAKPMKNLNPKGKTTK